MKNRVTLFAKHIFLCKINNNIKYNILSFKIQLTQGLNYAGSGFYRTVKVQ